MKSNEKDDEDDDDNEDNDDDDDDEDDEDVDKMSGHLSADGQAGQSDQTSFSRARRCLQLANIRHYIQNSKGTCPQKSFF